MTPLFEFLVGIIRELWPLQMVQAWEGGVRVRKGEYVKIVTPGLWLAIPFFDRFLLVDVKPQVVNLPNQSVRTADEQCLAVSGAIYYEIRDCQKALVELQDLDLSIQTLAMGVLARFVANTTFADCTMENMEGEVLKMLRQEAQGWGLKIKAFYITDSASHAVYRIMAEDTPAVVLPNAN